MWNWLTGGLSVLVACAFLGAIALTVNEWALWAAIALGVVGMIADYVWSAREGA